MSPITTSIHRLLDEAFAGVPVTAESQDLKEELRGSLAARAAELEDKGLTPAKAATTAFGELGDVDEIVAPLRRGEARELSIAETYMAHRVRPRSAFVARTVSLAGVIVSATTLAVLAAAGVIDWGLGVQLALLLGGAAVPAALLTADSVHQETTSAYPVPARRAVWYGVSAGLGVAGISMGAAIAADTSAAWPYAVGVPLFAAFALSLTYLVVTQSNRQKAWVREVERRALRGETSAWEHADAFAGDPEGAARFGVYTGTLWVAAIIVFVVVTIVVNVLWALLSLGLAIIGTMLLLARMGFSTRRQPKN